MKPLAARMAQSAPSTHRTIQGLQWVELCWNSPWPKVRLRGSKARGITYQNRLGNHLRNQFGEQLYSGQWLRYLDANGPGFAQPDFYLVGPHSTIVWEAKLTQREQAYRQISQLYRP